mgnify:CR=1 FL=1
MPPALSLSGSDTTNAKDNITGGELRPNRIQDQVPGYERKAGIRSITFVNRSHKPMRQKYLSQDYIYLLRQRHGDWA